MTVFVIFLNVFVISFFMTKRNKQRRLILIKYQLPKDVEQIKFEFLKLVCWYQIKKLTYKNV